MSLELWLSFCVLETLLCLSPGPAVLFVTSTTLKQGGKAGAYGMAGILASNTFYFILSATGIAAILLASNFLFTILKWAGGLYLIWLGLKMLFSRTMATEQLEPALASESVVKGFMVQTLNPKALAFFFALLPQFIDAAKPILPQVSILGVSSVAIEFCVMCGYIWLSLRTRQYAGAVWSLFIQRFAGGFLILAGARLTMLKNWTSS